MQAAPSPKPSLFLAGHIAVITGASRGIGAALAVQLGAAHRPHRWWFGSDG
jgi:hypothetical protein